MKQKIIQFIKTIFRYSKRGVENLCENLSGEVILHEIDLPPLGREGIAQDKKNIASDWRAVGNDMKSVMRKIKK